MTDVAKLTNADLVALAETSAFTIVGARGDLSEWIVGVTELLTEKEIGIPQKWMSFTGKQMNDVFGLTGKNRYKSRLTFLAFSLDGLDIGKLAMFKLRFGAHWFDDIVDNNAARENAGDRDDDC